MRNRTLKASNAVHVFQLFCRSGNRVAVALTIPQPGRFLEFSFDWVTPASFEDESERQLWLGAVQESLSEIAGRELRLTLTEAA
jgi:hypothetical protein